jgi:hypothetical protein
MDSGLKDFQCWIIRTSWKSQGWEGGLAPAGSAKFDGVKIHSWLGIASIRLAHDELKKLFLGTALTFGFSFNCAFRNTVGSVDRAGGSARDYAGQGVFREAF